MASNGGSNATGTWWNRQNKTTILQFLCGGIAGAVSRTVVAPLDRIKILMQTQHISYHGMAKYTGIWQGWSTIVKEEGVMWLWRGNAVTVVRVVPFAATQFASYDWFKQTMTASAHKTAHLTTAHKTAHLTTEHKTTHLTTGQRLTAGALAGITATTMTHPLDVVRLRVAIQPELRGALHALQNIMQEAGVSGLFKGYVPTVIAVAPFVAINFAAFDVLKHHFARGTPDVDAAQTAGRAVEHQQHQHQHQHQHAQAEGQTSPRPQRLHPGLVLCLGAASGLIAQSTCHPLDTIRRRMQMKGRVYSSLWSAAATIARTEGIAGFYRGMVPNAAKVLPNNAIRFLVYDFLKSKLHVQDGGNASIGG